jgi:hypothetical protein
MHACGVQGLWAGRSPASDGSAAGRLRTGGHGLCSYRAASAGCLPGAQDGQNAAHGVAAAGGPAAVSMPRGSECDESYEWGEMRASMTCRLSLAFHVSGGTTLRGRWSRSKSSRGPSSTVSGPIPKPQTPKPQNPPHQAMLHCHSAPIKPFLNALSKPLPEPDDKQLLYWSVNRWGEVGRVDAPTMNPQDAKK